MRLARFALPVLVLLSPLPAAAQWAGSSYDRPCFGGCGGWGGPAFEPGAGWDGGFSPRRPAWRRAALEWRRFAAWRSEMEAEDRARRARAASVARSHDRIWGGGRVSAAARPAVPAAARTIVRPGPVLLRSAAALKARPSGLALDGVAARPPAFGGVVRRSAPAVAMMARPGRPAPRATVEPAPQARPSAAPATYRPAARVPAPTLATPSPVVPPPPPAPASVGPNAGDVPVAPLD